MIKIGITGSIASGKTTASKILSYRRGPLFSADNEISKFYRDNNFKKYLIKKFNIKTGSNLKNSLKQKIFDNNNNIKKLEKIIHPLVRKKMKKFFIKNRKKNKTFCEIPLLIENKLMKYFDIIIFFKTNKITRFKRFKASGGDENLFQIQKFCKIAAGKGLYFHPHHNWFVSNSHSIADLDLALDLADEAMNELLHLENS